MTPEQYCHTKSTHSESSFYYSFLFLPKEKKYAIMALYSFCREIDDIVDQNTNTSLAQKKLYWWRNEIKKTFYGNPDHPIAKSLVQVIRKYHLEESYFLEIIDGMEMDLKYASYPTFTELSLYCYRVAGVVGILTAKIFGFKNQDTIKYACNLGMAFQCTNILRDIHEDILRNRIYIPLDELEKFFIKPEQLHMQNTSNDLRKLFEFQAQRAETYYKKAFNYLPEGDRYNQLSGIIMSAIYHALLKKISTMKYRVLEKRISLTPIRKLYISWNTARIEKNRYKKICDQTK